LFKPVNDLLGGDFAQGTVAFSSMSGVP